jgi:hypothetical protein
LTQSILKFKSVFKDRLFYNQFEYCMNFYLDEVSCLRDLTHDSIDSMIEHRRVWRELARQRHANLKHGIGQLRPRIKDITDDTVKNLHTLADILIDTQIPFKSVVSASHMWVYVNDITLLNQLSNLPELTQKFYNRAVVNRPKNTIKLKKSAYLYRSYLKLEKLSSEEKQQIVNFLRNQQDHVRLSPSLTHWLDHKFTRTQDHFFIEYTEPSWLTMLSLVRSGMIRKTLNIITAK